MRRGTLRALSVVAGVLLIIAGVVCLCHQETAALSAGILLGVFMLISGVAEIALFIWGRDFYFGAALRDFMAGRVEVAAGESFLHPFLPGE